MVPTDAFQKGNASFLNIGPPGFVDEPAAVIGTVYTKAGVDLGLGLCIDLSDE